MPEATPSSVADTPSPPATLWRPFRTPIFRNLFVADLLSDMGTFMQSVGSAWLMVSLGASPTFVALTQTASSLPFFVFALPAGSIGDIVDRRKLILYCEYWMVAMATILALLTIGGVMTPWLLLVLTFALSAGDALETPTWRAMLPELVTKDDLAAASALNGIEFNIARAVGPALAGALIAVAGVGAAFIVNVISFVGVIVVVMRWKRPVRKLFTPVETVSGATIAVIRYIRHSPAIRFVMMRAGVTMFAASALLALLPSLAHAVSASPTVYGVLLGCFGGGAILGALAMQPARRRWSFEVVASSAVVILGAMTVAAGLTRGVLLLAVLLATAGAGWIVFISLVSALVQRMAPDWARARIVAAFVLVFQGGLAVGSAVWGATAAKIGIPTTLVVAGLATIATVVLGAVARFPEGTADLTPWNHWRLPDVAKADTPSLEDGPVLVSVRYHVMDARREEFLVAIQEYGRLRRRDGATWWGIFRDIEERDLFIEAFLVGSWAEHLRQHDRFTRADREVEDRINTYLSGEPEVRHLIAADVES